MKLREYITSQLLPALSNINHPIEGMFYLVVLALFVRWKWPRTWNKLLHRFEAEIDSSSKSKDKSSDASNACFKEGQSSK